MVDGKNRLLVKPEQSGDNLEKENRRQEEIKDFCVGFLEFFPVGNNPYSSQPVRGSQEESTVERDSGGCRDCRDRAVRTRGTRPSAKKYLAEGSN